jgi:hypothetical protein
LHPTRSRVLRRWYFVSLLLALSILLLLRFTVLKTVPNPSDYGLTAATVLDTLVASAVTSLVVGIAYVLLFPEGSSVALEEVPSRDIEAALEQATQHTRKWRVRARTANYFARMTLPALTKEALRSGRSINVRVQMLDPENPTLMAGYARFKSNHRGAAARWTPDKVRREIYATMLQLALHRHEAPRLEIEVGLSPALWVISLDASDDIAMITGQNRGDTAIVFRAGSQFYESYCDDFDASFSECRRLQVPAVETLTPSLDPSDLSASQFDELRTFFQEVGLSDCGDQELHAIVKTLHEKHNYA